MSFHPHVNALVRAGLLAVLAASAGCHVSRCRPQIDPYDLLPGCFDTRVASPLCTNDPCYGFRPTCWRSWDPCCPVCPPPSSEAACPGQGSSQESRLELRAIPEGTLDIESVAPGKPTPEAEDVAPQGEILPESGQTAPEPPQTLLVPPASIEPEADDAPVETSLGNDRVVMKPVVTKPSPSRTDSTIRLASHPKPETAPPGITLLESPHPSQQEQNESAKVKVLSKPPHLRGR